MTDEYRVDYRAALERLQVGNREYCGGGSAPRPTQTDRRRLVEDGQRPFACIVCCSDSRVVPEHIFSAGLGALFTVRTAGNVIGTHELASVEYAVLHLHTPLVVVMGHTHCGAVAAAAGGHAEGAIRAVADKIRAAVTDPSDIRKCERQNAEHGVRELLKSPLLSEAARTGTVKLTAAMYDTESGRVSFEPLA